VRLATLALLIEGPTMTGLGGAAATAPTATTPAGTVRLPALAGSWYPGSPALLLATARSLMRQASAAPMPYGRPVALAVPHAAWAYSGTVAAAAFRILTPGSFARVVVMGPSHHVPFTGYALEDAAAYRTPLGEIPLDRAALRDLETPGLARVVPGATGPEHAVEIELPFLQAALGPFTLVPILAGRVDAAAEKAFAEKLARLDDGKTLFVFSSDLTHYGPRFDYMPFGPTAGARAKIRELDDSAIGLLTRLDAEGWRSFVREKKATICGEAGLVTMLELLRRIVPSAKATLLAHWASGEMPGVRDDSSVDYASLAFTREGGAAGEAMNAPPRIAAVAADAPPVADAVGRALVRVARGALDADLRGDTAPLDTALRELAAGRASFPLQAVFVTLKRKDPAAIARLGDLRGCIGQVVPTYPLDLAVVRSALEAALDDPRFPGVEAQELPGLAVEVTVLSPIVPIGSWKEIRIGTHGIVLEKRGHRALFLPQIASEQGWTLEETLDALAQKAGLSRGEWRSGATFSVFAGQVFHEAAARAAPLPKR
jgi:AmmeMemoRadiSam system protein B/AmmeMemoRadiSam system protein A